MTENAIGNADFGQRVDSQLGKLLYSNDCIRRLCDDQNIHYITVDPLGAQSFCCISPPPRRSAERGNHLTIPGMTLLLKDIKTLEDYARACRSKDEERMVLVTREEADVLESFRRFKNQESY